MLPILSFANISQLPGYLKRHYSRTKTIKYYFFAKAFQETDKYFTLLNKDFDIQRKYRRKVLHI